MSDDLREKFMPVKETEPVEKYGCCVICELSKLEHVHKFTMIECIINSFDDFMMD